MEYGMETRNQIMHGLGAFISGAVATILLVNGILFVFPTAAEYITPGISLGIFILVWWASYLTIIHEVRKRNTHERPECR
jgi:hypothetical protein